MANVQVGHVHSGIPQGSVLGPTLFVIFINDMPNAIKNSCMLFADDAKLYRTIQTKEDASSLQEDIDSLVRWSLNWQLPFNVEKCKIMRIGNDKNPQTYYMNEQPLDYVKEEKIFGPFIERHGYVPDFGNLQS